MTMLVSKNQLCILILKNKNQNKEKKEKVSHMPIRSCKLVTLLAVMAARCIAVPLSPAFPAPELQYILNQSEASLLVSSDKFGAKAQEVLSTDLNVKPAHLKLEKHLGGGNLEDVTLDNVDPGQAGMMLYTSGTTNRPVRSSIGDNSGVSADLVFRKVFFSLSPS